MNTNENEIIQEKNNSDNIIYPFINMNITESACIIMAVFDNTHYMRIDIDPKYNKNELLSRVFSILHYIYNNLDLLSEIIISKNGKRLIIEFFNDDKEYEVGFANVKLTSEKCTITFDSGNTVDFSNNDFMTLLANNDISINLFESKIK